MSRIRAFTVPVLVASIAIGTLALTGATFVAAGLAPVTYAEASPATEPSRSQSTEKGSPRLVSLEATQQVAPAEATVPALLKTASVRAAAPIPKPRPVARPAAVPSRAPESSGWQSAKASWYGPGFYGRRTASGAVLTEDMMNVAHRSMAFGTRIQFEYRGQTAIAVVNDRGPFIGGRVFDLGPGTARALGFSGVGTVNYRILGR